jgi:hypothetical protein
MVLGFKTKFKNGKYTLFVQKILACVLPDYTKAFKPKKHSIRRGNRWKVGMKIHMATGVRTKDYFQFNINIDGLQVVTGVQVIDIKHFTLFPNAVVIDGKRLSNAEIDQLAINDGFDTTDEFWDYFSDDVFEGQIVHWMDERY